jgi:DNA-binding CsgD family transcriptional regulator
MKGCGVIRSDEQWLKLSDAFHAAALDGSRWYGALDQLAKATGSENGQLIGIGPNWNVSLDILTNIDPEFQKEFAAIGGGDPRVNPRVKAGLEAPILDTRAEADFITPDEYARHPHYQEFACPRNVPFICLTTLDRTPDSLTGLAVVRTHAQGHITTEQRRVFASIAPHVRAAVRTHLALQGQGEALLTGTLEALSIAAFICDGSGLVRKLTPAAEKLVSADGALRLGSGRLSAATSFDAKVLSDAVLGATTDRAKVGAPFARTVIVRKSERDLSPLVVDVIGLPAREFELMLVPRVLVVVRGADNRQRRATVLQMVYGMTAAETDIALQLADGKTPEAIAAHRSVSVGTVRAQIKALLAKAGLSRQIELVARLSQFS